MEIVMTLVAPLLNFRFVGTALLVFMLSACAPQVAKVGFDKTTVLELRKFQAPATAARLYFLNGYANSPQSPLRQGFASALLLNGILVGEINKEDVLVADVVPGTYEATWQLAQMASDMADFDMPSTKINLKAGEIYVVKADVHQESSGILILGAVIGATRPQCRVSITKNSSDISTFNFIKPIACPKSLCL
jgi:hypothetical protein